MKTDLMSILIDSNLDYEFPYQIGLLFYDWFNESFEHKIINENPNFIDWTLSLNLSHSNKIKDIELKGPDVDKRNKIITYSIFNGSIDKNMEPREVTFIFMKNMFLSLDDIFFKSKIQIKPNSFKSFHEAFLINLKNNYYNYINDYTVE